MNQEIKKRFVSQKTGELLGFVNSENQYLYNMIERDVYLIPLPFICDKDNTIWMPVSECCRRIGLSDHKAKGELSRMKRDPFLEMQSKVLIVNTKTGKQPDDRFQKTVCINWKAFIIWMMKLNHKTLPPKAYSYSMQIINKACSVNLPLEKPYGKLFLCEKELQDKIIEIGYVLDIKIIGQEVIYPFGRIDLLGKDSHGKRVCIELKNNIEFKDTKKQLLRYKKSNEFDRLVYIANQISDELKNFLENNNIEYLTYIRNEDKLFFG